MCKKFVVKHYAPKNKLGSIDSKCEHGCRGANVELLMESSPTNIDDQSKIGLDGKFNLFYGTAEILQPLEWFLHQIDGISGDEWTACTLCERAIDAFTV
jgi:hypothetical protein